MSEPRRPRLKRPPNPQEWVGRDAYDIDGDKVGTITDVYLDDATGHPEWIAVKTGWFGNNVSFVPASKAKPGPNGPALGFDKSVIKKAPNVDADGALSVEEEEELYRYYDMTYDPSLRSSRGGAEALQEYGSSAASEELSAEAAVARLRRRDDAEVAAMFGEDQVDK